MKTTHDKHWHELKKRSAHQKAQPTDRHDVNHDKGLSLRRLDWDGGISITRRHQAFGHNERDECRGEIGHRPAG
jgi:hypothetical protein